MGGGKGGGGGNTTTVTKSDPWSGQQPYLTQQFKDAQKLYQGGQLAPQYYSGQTVANQSPQTQQAIQALTTTALSPQQTGLADSANKQVTDTLNGDYLDPTKNPGFQQALSDTQKAYSTGTAAQTDAAFNNAGGYGGSAYNETKGMQNKAYADSLNSLAGAMYTQGRGQQLQAAQLAPSTNALPYSNIAELANAGSAQDAYSQSQINSNVDKYNYNSNLPSNALRNYVGLTGGTYGGTSTQSSPYSSNAGANGLGGAISGAVAGSMLPSSLFQGAVGALGPQIPGALSFLGASGGSLLGGGLGLGLGLLSDIRAKDDITFVGFEKGFPVYDFAYKHDEKKTRYRGVMAQDVLRLRPDAIGGRDEYFTVDYNKIGMEMREVG